MKNNPHDIREFIVQELRRMADEVEEGSNLGRVVSDGFTLADAVIEDLGDRLFGETPPRVGPFEINGVEGFSLVDALEAFVQAGAIHIDIHPAFWDSWNALLTTFRVDRNGPDEFSPCIEISGEGPLQTKRGLVRVFEPCDNILCASCRYLAAQWAHRMPEEPPQPAKPDPSLN